MEFFQAKFDAMKFKIPVPYVWSLYIVFTDLALTLNLAGAQTIIGELAWDRMLSCLLLISFYAVLTARQLYTHGRIWPQKALFFSLPLSFIHLLFDGPFSINLGLFLVNMLFWWVAYCLSGRLAAVSPYGGPSGYL